MKYLQPIFFLLILAFTASCLDENTFTRTIDVLPTQPKVVVFGFLNPSEDSLEIYVSKSNTVNSLSVNNEEQLEDARVVLRNGNNEVIVPWHGVSHVEDTVTYWSYYIPGGFKLATKDFPMQPGDTIRLSVSTKIGTVNSFCVIPEANQVMPAIDKLRKDRTNNEMSAHVVFNNFPGKESYYHLLAEVSSVYKGTNLVYNTRELSPESAENYFVHKTTDAPEVKFLFKGTYYSYESDYISDSVIVYMARTDDNYYKYHKSYQYFIDSDENPFAEPVSLYSNVKGGLGVFCAYNKKRYAFAVKDYLNRE